METLINCLICASGGGIVPLSVERGGESYEAVQDRRREAS